MQWGFYKYVLSKKINTDILINLHLQTENWLLFSSEMCDVNFKLRA